jgi:hypothetical protein
MSSPTETTSSELFLVLHKVRGKPAFDIAEQMEVGDELWWIIPTSGHRAYPCFWWRLDEIIQEDMRAPYIPDDLPDHYTVNAEKVRVLTNRLFKLLGIGKKQSNLGLR